jgi:hypothetical protein
MIDKNKIKWDMFKGDCERMNLIKGKLRRKKIDAKEKKYSF